MNGLRLTFEPDDSATNCERTVEPTRNGVNLLIPGSLIRVIFHANPVKFLIVFHSEAWRASPGDMKTNPDQDTFPVTILVADMREKWNSQLGTNNTEILSIFLFLVFKRGFGIRLDRVRYSLKTKRFDRGSH